MRDLSLTDYLHVVRRRLWIVLVAVLIVTLGAVLYSLRQAPVYEASADVLLRSQTLPSTISGLNDANTSPYYVDPQRATTTQIDLARLPLMANRVLAASPQADLSPGSFLGSSGVSALPNSDFLRFSVSASDPAVATALANEYARQYTLYRKQLDTQVTKSSLRTLNARIARLKSAGDRLSLANAKQLQQKSDQLQTLMSLQQANAVVVRNADGAPKVEPRPVRNGILGFALGLVLGIGLALLREASDTRVRSPEQVAGILDHLPLLARLPAPGRSVRRSGSLAMLADPTGLSAEAFRMMRTNLEFTSLGRQARVIMITSALEGEGKSTTAGNLAVALARSGKHVALVDLDLRRPALHRFFNLDPAVPGLTDVVLGHATLYNALVSVPLAANAASEGRTGIAASGNGNARTLAEGALEVLGSGPLPPNPGEFVGSDRVRRLVGELRERADFVVIDVPPVLHVGDPMTTAAYVDGVVIVVKLDAARRPVLAELARVISHAPTEPLGFVVCGTTQAVGSYQYSGYGYARQAGQRAKAEPIR